MESPNCGRTNILKTLRNTSSKSTKAPLTRYELDIADFDTFKRENGGFIETVVPAPASASIRTAPTPTKVASNTRAALPSATVTSTIAVTTAAATTNTTTSTSPETDRNAPDSPSTSSTVDSDDVHRDLHSKVQQAA
ncbi:hypothetical protein SprV_0401494700 [Sparganum proliferum]